MAKVKIQGHASGTGVITVTAPNTSTDRVITLPDSTDTLIGSATTDALTTRVNATGGRKNMVINGGFDVWQRGTSTTAFSSSTGYIADRFKITSVALAGRSTDVPSSESFKYSIKIDQNTTADPWILQGIEGMDKFIGKTVTLSYWIKPSITTTLRDDYLKTAHGTHAISANVWQKLTNTFVVPAGTTDGEFLYIQFPANTVATYYITGLQLELGSVATDFEQRSYGEELALCQRYYEQTTEVGEQFPLAKGREADRLRISSYQYQTTKRVNPSITLLGASGDGGPTPSASGIGTHAFRATCSATGDGQSPYFNGYKADAEL